MHLLLLPILGFMIYFKRGKVTCLKSTCYIRPILYYLGHLFFVILLVDGCLKMAFSIRESHNYYLCYLGGKDPNNYKNVISPLGLKENKTEIAG